MSYAAERWARSQTVGNSTAKAVLRELAFYHNGQTGLCCPSVSKIARVLEVKKADTITAAIKRLEEGGFISREFIRDPETGQILRTEYALIGFVASEWVSSKNQDTSPEDQGASPENRGTVPQKRGRGSPEKRGEGSPENQDVTGNRNREVEQGIACPRKRRGKPTILPTTVKRSKSRNGKQRTKALDSQSQNSQTTGRLSPNRKNPTSTRNASLKTSTTTGTDYQEQRQSKRTGRPHGETSSEASTTPKTGNVVRCSNVLLLIHLQDLVSSLRKNNPSVTTLTGKQKIDY